MNCIDRIWTRATGTTTTCALAVWALTVWLSVPLAAASAPRPVAPGSSDNWSRVPEGCATFHWVPTAAGQELELAVYAAAAYDGSGSKNDLELVARVFLPGGAAGWTPPLEECLPRGERYAWSIRERTEEGWNEWSEALLFEVSPIPSPREARAAALLLTESEVEAGSSHRPTIEESPLTALDSCGPPPHTMATSQERSISWRRGPRASSGIAALRGVQTDASGETYGVHGVSDSGGDGSAGLIGESTAATGPVAGVVGRVSSPEGTAGVFENTTGGPILQVYGPDWSFAVDGDGDVLAAGTITAQSFVGDGSALSGIDARLVDGQPASAYDGDIQSVTAGSGLTGGGTSGEVALAVADKGVTRLHLASNSVGASEISPGSIFGSKVIEGSLSSADLAPSSITAVELQNAAIQSSHIADGSLTKEDIDAGSVQRRVSGACGGGSALRGINQDGSAICEDDDFLPVGYTDVMTASAFNGNNDYVTIEADDNFCFLVYVRLRDIEDADESASCEVRYGSNLDPPIWRLAAISNNDADAVCQMRCLTWGQ